MPKELVTWEAVKETGTAITSVANAVKGASDLVSSHKEKKFNSDLRNIEKKALIKVAEDKAKLIRTTHQIHNINAVYEQVDSISNPHSRKKCERLAAKLADGYICDD